MNATTTVGPQPTTITWVRGRDGSMAGAVLAAAAWLGAHATLTERGAFLQEEDQGWWMALIVDAEE